MAEWSKAAVLKTADGASCPGVRIPSPPPTKTRKRWARCLWLRGAGGVHARPFPSVSTNPCGGVTTPSGNALKHVIYTFSRAGPLVRWPSVDLHANDEMTNSRRAVVTLRPFSAGEARTPNASPFLGRSSSESQLVTAPCHSLSQLRRGPAIRAFRVRRAAPDLADEAEIGKPLEVPLHGSPRDIGQQLFGLRQRQRASLE